MDHTYMLLLFKQDINFFSMTGRHSRKSLGHRSRSVPRSGELHQRGQLHEHDWSVINIINLKKNKYTNCVFFSIKTTLKTHAKQNQEVFFYHFVNPTKDKYV